MFPVRMCMDLFLVYKSSAFILGSPLEFTRPPAVPHGRPGTSSSTSASIAIATWLSMLAKHDLKVKVPLGLAYLHPVGGSTAAIPSDLM